MTLLLNLLALSFLANAHGPTFPISPLKPVSQFYYTESVNNMDGFWAFQESGLLDDLDNSKKESTLCGPAAVTQVLFHQKFFSRSKAPNLDLPANPYLGPSDQVRRFAELCKWDQETGTWTSDLADCLKAFYVSSGYPNADVRVLHANPEGSQSKISIAEIREAVKKDYGVILNFQNYKRNTKNTGWDWVFGHFVSVVGYDWDQSFGDQRITLKFVDPGYDYSGYDAIARFNKKDLFVSSVWPTGFILDYTLGIETVDMVEAVILAKPNP